MLRSYRSIGYLTDMHKPADNPLTIGYNAARPIPAAGRASGPAFMIGSYASHAQHSALALFGAHKNSPQRSAGSFNILHPKRKALTSAAAEHRSAADVAVKTDENVDVLMCCGMDTAVGACPPFFSSSSCFIINAYPWENRPLLPNMPMLKAPPEPGDILPTKKRFDIPFGKHEVSGNMHHDISYRGPANMVYDGITGEEEHRDLLGSAEQETDTFLDSGSVVSERSCIYGFNSAASKPSLEAGDMQGKPSLVRSCSLLSISPTSFSVVEESSPLSTASSLYSSREGMAGGRKRSFSATELSSAELSSCKGNKPQKMQSKTKPHGQKATDLKSITAAKAKRENLSKKIRMLQSLVPNGENLDTVSMLGQTLEYIRFLQYQLGELYDQASDDHTGMSHSNINKWKAFMEIPPTTTLESTSSTLTTL